MASFSTLQDNFDDNSLNTGLWYTFQNTGATVSETAGEVRAIISPNNHTGAGYNSLTNYALTNDAVYLQVSESSRTANAYTSLSVNSTTISLSLSIYQIDVNTLTFSYNSTTVSNSTSITYSSTSHLWWKIANVAGNILFQTSPDGNTWTTQLTVSNALSLANMEVLFGTYTQTTSIATFTQARFDNFNIGNGSRTIVETASPGGAAVLVSETAQIDILETASGGGLATYLSVFQPLPQKEYEYRIYDSHWNYIGVWQDILSDFGYSQNINENASPLNVTIGRSPDNRSVSYDTLLDETSSPILDTNGDPIRGQVSTANSVGSDTDVDLNYNVEVYAFYGGYDQLLDENADPILDENHDPILSQYGAPNGLRVYSGYIVDYSLKFAAKMGLDVVIVPHATEQAHYVFKSGSATTVHYTSTDPVKMARDAMDNYISQGGYITYNSSTMPLSGTVSDYDFKLQTTRESIDKTIDLLPSGWYQFVDPGENLQYMKQRGVTADHTFWYEKHLTELDLRKSLTQLINKVYFTGGDTGGGVSLFKYYEDTTSISTYRPGLDRESDSRVTLATSADIISQSKIDDYKNPRYRTSITIIDAVYDIETIQLGDMIAFKNFANFVDTLLLQVVSINRQPHSITLDLDMVVDSDSKRLQDIYRQLRSQEAEAIPSTPS